MDFKYYNPQNLLRELRKRDIVRGAYDVCMGCVFTHVPPEDCYHPVDDFEETSIQSEKVCPHCAITIEEGKEPFHFHTDKTISDRVNELEAILEML